MNPTEGGPLPRFTIVTPVRNGMPWLPAAVAAVDAQRAEVEVEHIVLDAGSTDGSREWLLAYAGRSAQLVFEPDRGQTDALIRGFGMATGDIFGWLNADDILEAGALGRAAAALIAHPAAVGVSGAAILIGPNNEVLGAIQAPPTGTFQGLLAHPTNLAQPSTFFRRTAYESVGGLDPDLTLAMDVDLWLKVARLGDFVLLPDHVLSRFRVHPEAKSVVAARRTIREDLAIRRRHGLRFTDGAALYLLKGLYWHPFKRRVQTFFGPR